MPTELREVHGEEIPIYTVGTKVHTVDTIKAKYRDRTGTIVLVNLEVFPFYGKRPEIKRSHHLEYGLNFRDAITKENIANARTEAWFLPTEITEVK